MANEIKVTIGCSYINGRLREQFGTPLELQNVPRLASDSSKHLDTLFVASGVDQSTLGVDAGVVTAGTGITELDTYNNSKVATAGWLFMQNIEAVPSGDYIEWGPRVTYNAANAISMTGPDGVAMDLQSNNGDVVMVPFGRLEAGESAAMRVTPSGLNIGIVAGSGLSTIATPGNPSAKLKYILFAD
tara:strand:- start:3828 stop:4388 length:561 start_codon:yes stop_codon:yes gene_type:complete